MCNILQISYGMLDCLTCFGFLCFEGLVENRGSFAFLDISKLTTNPLINSTIVFYSPIPTKYFLPHQKILTRTKVTTSQTFKSKRTIVQTSESKTAPVNCTCTCAPSNHNNRYCVHTMFSFVSMLPCFSP